MTKEDDAAPGATADRDQPGDPELEPTRLSAFWKIGIALVVVVAAAAAAGIGAAIVRITCESNCAIPYIGGVGLGLAFGGFGTLILGVLVARSMQEWSQYHKTPEDGGDGFPD